MLISPEHFELNQKYQNLVLKSMQSEKMMEKKEEDYRNLLSKFTPLQNFVEQLAAQMEALQSQYASALKIISDKDKELQKLSLIEHLLKVTTARPVSYL